MIWIPVLLIIFLLVSLVTRNVLGDTKKAKLIEDITHTLIILIPIIYMLVLSFQYHVVLFIISLIIGIAFLGIEVFCKWITVEKPSQVFGYLQIGLIIIILIIITLLH